MRASASRRGTPARGTPPWPVDMRIDAVTRTGHKRGDQEGPTRGTASGVSVAAPPGGARMNPAFRSYYADPGDVRNFGAIGDGKEHPLSERYATPEAAWKDYPTLGKVGDRPARLPVSPRPSIGLPSRLLSTPRLRSTSRVARSASKTPSCSGRTRSSPAKARDRSSTTRARRGHQRWRRPSSDQHHPVQLPADGHGLHGEGRRHHAGDRDRDQERLWLHLRARDDPGWQDALHGGRHPDTGFVLDRRHRWPEHRRRAHRRLLCHRLRG